MNLNKNRENKKCIEIVQYARKVCCTWWNIHSIRTKLHAVNPDKANYIYHNLDV